ncbi:MAG: class I SAM-dependent methyltransferase [Actinomycetota bacterium]|nr:class I SAM-dependent methyltransferase [Actinomycetota bacterium]
MLEDLPTPQEDLHNFRPGGVGSGLGRQQNQLAMLERYGLRPSSRVLEIGCGVGWLAYNLASRLTEAGGYAGLDIGDAVISWLNDNYASRLPNFRFDLLDVKNARYRPKGARKPERVRFPHDDDQFDIACAFNVFVYMTERGITNYLREVARVLRADGRGLMTFRAIIDGDLGPREGERTYTRVRPGVYTRRPERDGWAMAYDDALIRSMIDRAGLDTYAFEIGGWHTPPSVPGSAQGSDTPQQGADLYVVTPKQHQPSRRPLARGLRVARFSNGGPTGR